MSYLSSSIYSPSAKNKSPKYLFKYLENNKKIYLINHKKDTNYNNYNKYYRFLEFYTEQFKDNTAIIGYLPLDLASMKILYINKNNIYPYRTSVYDAKLLSDSMNLPLVVYIYPWCHIDSIEEVFYHKPEHNQLRIMEKIRKKI
jgi:hypothetical protein